MEQTTSYDLLNKIDSPEDLRKLSVEALPEVCNQLRNKIIDELSRNPGHFGSSLGVIELTVALHYVYQTPYDRIVWDVGHQAYGHKILTGRRDRFCTNRKLVFVLSLLLQKVNMILLRVDMRRILFRLHWVWQWQLRGKEKITVMWWPLLATVP